MTLSSSSLWDEAVAVTATCPEFYCFEPYDVPKRPATVVETARKDGVNFSDPEFTRVFGADPHPFQTGYLLDNIFFQVILKGTQTGGSIVTMVDLVIRLTHEIPFSMRADAGEVTPYKRICDFSTQYYRDRTLENIQRWGRFDVKTGEFIDKPKVDWNTRTYKAKEDVGDDEWDCGNIIAVGKYPDAKLAADGTQVWIGSTAKALVDTWWPFLKSPNERLIPPHCIDKTRGQEGYSVQQNIAYLKRGCSIQVKSYEMEYVAFESKRAMSVPRIVLDEEPPDERIFVSAQEHTESLGMVFTPYRGLTWSRDKVFGASSPDKRVYHSTQYDCPYKPTKDIARRKREYKPWEVKARIYGIPAEQTGEPYYDREKLMLWIDRHIPSGKAVTLDPSDPWFEVTDLMNIPIMVNDKMLGLNDRDTWEVWEEPMPECAYWMGIDWGLGAKDPADAAKAARSNRNAACIFRAPRAENGETEPIWAAAIRSTHETQEFARMCLYALRWYNNALACPEARGYDAGTGIAEIRDYPFIYHMTVTSDATRKPTSKIGFDTNARTRTTIFDYVGEWIKSHDEFHSRIPHMATLKEMAACIKGKNGRPDHTSVGTLDSVIPFGICLYVWKHSRQDIRDNSAYGEQNTLDRSRPYGNIYNNAYETRPVLGSRRGLDQREREQANKRRRPVKIPVRL